MRAATPTSMTSENLPPAMARSTAADELPSHSTSSSSPPRPAVTLVHPKKKKPAVKNAKAFQLFRSLLRSFPIISAPSSRLHYAAFPCACRPSDGRGHMSGATHVTVTLFGHRRSRISLALQETPRGVPILLLELPISTDKFTQEMGADHLRLALECEKKATEKTKLLKEPLWTNFISGRKTGYAVRREPSESDLVVMQLLYTVSTGAGVLPDKMTDPTEGEMTYMRAHFDRVVGNKDSETLYMVNPDGNSGPELTIFFVRI